MNLSNSLLDLKPLGKGLFFPLTISSSTGDFKTAEGEENIMCCIDLILTTPVGTRQHNEDFGTQLNSLLFDSTAAVVDVLPTMCVEAIRRWEPRVKDVKATARAFDDQNRVDVLISFTIKATGERVTNREYPYYLGNQGAF